MLESVADNGHSFEECQEILKKSTSLRRDRRAAHADGCVSVDIKLDPGFKDFYRWCKESGIPVIIVSRRVCLYAFALPPDPDPMRAAG